MATYATYVSEPGTYGTVVDNQSPQIGYLGGKLMYRRDFFRIELQISKDVEKSISEVFPTSD
jgi:hypothetical protein